MHKKIFKISTVAFLGLMTFGYAQTTTPYEGKVGINNETPKATLEITAYQNTGKTKEGLLIPRLGKAVAKAMITQFPNSGNNKIEESTLIYVTDNVGTGDNAQFVGTGKGFYYFDAAAYKWTKLGTGESGATVDPKVFTAKLEQTMSNNYNWYKDNYVGSDQSKKVLVDFYEFTVDGGGFKLPNPAEHSGAIIHVKNSTGGLINFAGTEGVDFAKGVAAITGSSSQIYWSNGTFWYLIGGRN